MLQFRLLAQFDVRADGKRVVISSRAAQSLFAFLILNPNVAHRREKLAGMLWADMPEENARHNLRQELWRLRKALALQESQSGDYILADELTIAFNGSAEHWLDVAQLTRETPDASTGELLSQVSLYRGELLPGFYDDWVLLERERVQALYERKMQTLLERLIAEQQWHVVLEWAERWIALGDTPEPAYRAQMVAHNALGNSSQVALAYERCVEALRNELGVEPSADTRALYEQLARGDANARAIVAPLPSILVQPSGTVTFMFTDIEGSTKLLERLGNDYAKLLEEHYDLFRALGEKHNGHEIDTQGDAFFFAFFRAADAVSFAADAQRALAAHSWPQNVNLRVRMGLHTGEPMLARTGYVGMDVHRAARIGAAGHGGQVLMSRTTRDLVENDLPNGTHLTDLGEHQLKDLRYPVHIVQLSIDDLPSEFPPLKVLNTGSEPPAPGEPPFKGLQFFDESDAALFFGREQTVAHLRDALHQNQFLAVVIGASGSGKSSIVRAGLIPALKNGEGRLETGDWRFFVMTPTAHPLEALATVLTRDVESVTATATLIDDLAKDPRSLHLFLRRQESVISNQSSVAGAQSSVLIPHHLLVIDQFEELFTLCHDEYEREAFIDNLLYALGQSRVNRNQSSVISHHSPSPHHPLSPSPVHPLTVVLTLRADFYAHLAQYPELRDAVAKQQAYIGPMNAEELRRAIVEPANRGGWELEAGLVDLMLRDVGDEPGALPLLSHALLETWKRRSGHLLTLKGYHDAGGVRGAIAHTAETTYQQLTPEQQDIARAIFLRLTELGDATEDTRRRASYDELIPRGQDGAAVRTVLVKLADARLITTNETTAEVAHEALIREWPRLREWLNQDREGLKLHRNLTEAAQEWELLERDAGALYRGARLAQAIEYAAANPNALNVQERAFLEASQENEKREAREREEQQKRELEQAQKLAETESKRAQEQQRSARRLRWFAAGLAVFLLVALGAAYFAFNQSAAAQNNFTTAERIRLASQAQIALDNGEGGDLPALLSLQSMKHGYSPEADASLLNALKRGFTKQIFAGHSDLVFDVDYSPDGKYVATGSADATARVWDVQTGQEILKISPPVRIINAIEYSPDGKYLLTGSPGTKTWLWDAKTGRQVQEFDGSTAGTWEVKFSPDGRYALTGDDSVTRLWDVEIGKQVRELNAHIPGETKGGNVALTFSPDGKQIATGELDGTIRIWDTVSGEQQKKFKIDGDYSVYLQYSPDGKELLSISGNIAQLFDSATGEELHRLIGHTDYTTWADFSPDGRLIVTASHDKTSRLWDAATGQELRQFIGHTAPLNPVSFSPDGQYVLTGSEDRTARLWQVFPETEPHQIRTTDFSSGIFGNAITPFLSPDANHVLRYTSGNQSLTVWNLASGEYDLLQVELNRPLQSITVFAFSPDNKLLLGGGDDGAVLLWNVANGKLLQTLERHTAPVRAVLFSPDGRMMLSASEDKSARLWDAQSGKELQYFQGHAEPVRAIAFSSDGKFVLTGSDDRTARLWDARTGKELKQFVGHTAPLRTVNFSPDGKFIVTSGDDQTARVWDVGSGKEIKQLVGHTGQVSQAMFSPDGKNILTGSADQTARLWDVSTALNTSAETGQLVRNFVGHVSPVLYIGFTDSGRTIITGDTQNAYRWRASLEDVIAFTCSQLTRDLTDDERALYRITNNAATCAP